MRKVTEKQRERQRREYIRIALKLLFANTSAYCAAFTTSDGEFFYEGSSYTYAMGACRRVSNAIEKDCLENDRPSPKDPGE